MSNTFDCVRRESGGGGLVALVAVLVVLVGCATSVPRGGEGESDMWVSIPIRTTPAEETPLPEYRLGFGDLLDIRFFYDDRFSDTQRVRPDGRITLQKVGDIDVLGLTPSELDARITELFSGILNDPEVTIIVREFGGMSAYVLGEVNRPGNFDVTSGLTILQALALSEGPTEAADMRSVIVLRRGASNDIVARRFDLSRSALKTSMDTDIQVRPYDIIYVPRTFVGSVSSFLKQVWDGLLPPVDVYLRALYWSRWKN